MHYKPVGHCIYCSRADVPLSDEHIIPLGLNGTRVLPKASCEACAKVTSRIEHGLLRGEMHQVRAALSFTTRRAKEMPTEFPLLVTRGGKEEVRQTPLRDHLIVMPLPLYAPPAFLKEYDYEKGIALTGMQIIRLGDEPAELLKRHVADKVGLQARLDHNLFARFLSKIAYASAVAELGAKAMGPVYVLPTIFGDMSESGRWIGSSDGVLAPESATTQHVCMVQTNRMSDEHGAKSTVVVLLKLFANLPTPGYAVIVGELEEASSRGA